MTVAPPIREPSVDIFQEVVPVPTVPAQETLPALCIAPNYQVIRAQDSAGNLNPSAKMGAYQDLDLAITYALPSLEQGSVFQASTLRAFLAVGNEVQELDGVDDEQTIIDSNATGIVLDSVAPDEHEFTDGTQNFVDSGILASQEIEANDYVVRMLGADGNVHDFPILVVAPELPVPGIPNPQKLVIGNDPDGDIKPSNIVLDYEVILNPAKFILNVAAIAAELRINSATAVTTVLGGGGVDSDTVYTSVLPGDAGNSVEVEHVDPSPALSVPLSVSVVGQKVTVTLATDGGGALDVSNTPLVISALVNGDPLASTLVSAAPDPGGAGAVSLTAGAVSAFLTGGSHLVYTATTAGAAGNAIRVLYADPGPSNPTIGLSLVGTDLTITPVTDGGGLITSTDTDIAVAITADLVVSALVGATAFGGTGLAQFAFLPLFTALSGGFDSNSVTVDANLVGNVAVTGAVYVYYKSLRRVFTAVASISTTGNDPVLVSANSPLALETLVGELTDDNPLGLMMDLALRNNPGARIYGLGIDAVTANEPDGTVGAWQRAGDFLTNQQPYYTAIGSQSEVVHDVMLGHIDQMNGDGFSIPAILERFLLINKEMPLTTPDQLLASGSDMDKVGVELVDGFNFTLGGILAGDVVVLNAGAITDNANATLQDGTEGYLIASVTGGGYNLALSGTPPAAVVNADFQVFRPGVPLLVGGVYDKLKIAETISQINDQIDRRKVSSTFPDNCIVTVSGVQKYLPGYYRDAAQVGQCASQRPSQSKVRQSLLGIDGVRNSSDFFSNGELNIIQGGGTWVYHQPVQGGSVLTRHSLTTDNENPLVRNPTSTWQVDRYARLARTSTRFTLGGTITQALLDDLLLKLGAIKRHLIERQELKAATIDGIRQGDGVEADIDNIIIEGEASPHQPNNGIRFYLAITA